MTRDEQRELDALAKTVSKGTTGRFTEDDATWLADVARRFATDAWRRDVLCTMCPRWMYKHTCSCPHFQARRRLMEFGYWPEGV